MRNASVSAGDSWGRGRFTMVAVPVGEDYPVAVFVRKQGDGVRPSKVSDRPGDIERLYQKVRREQRAAYRLLWLGLAVGEVRLTSRW